MVGQSLAYKNFFPNAFNAIEAFGPTYGTWLVKSCSKTLKLVYPSKLYIAKIFALSSKSLKNLMAIPGVTWAGFIVGWTAKENLNKALSHPFNIPVYGCYPLLTNLTSATIPTLWISLGLGLSKIGIPIDGMSSPLWSNDVLTFSMNAYGNSTEYGKPFGVQFS